MEIVKKIKKALKAAKFTDREIKTINELSAESDKVLGYIVSDRFDAMLPADRQKFIWDIFDKNLSQEECRDILMVIAITPEEYDDHQNDDTGLVVVEKSVKKAKAVPKKKRIKSVDVSISMKCPVRGKGKKSPRKEELGKGSSRKAHSGKLRA